jgi:hypothetical protein
MAAMPEAASFRKLRLFVDSFIKVKCWLAFWGCKIAISFGTFQCEWRQNFDLAMVVFSSYCKSGDCFLLADGFSIQEF